MKSNVLVAVVVGVLAAAAGRAPAQEPPKYDVLKKMYDDAVASLRASQEAKNQLAAKNDELTRQNADLQKQLDAVTRERDDLARQAATHAERTFALRSQQAAWQEFLKRYPTLLAQWRAFLSTDLLLTPSEPPALAEPAWPFKIDG